MRSNGVYYTILDEVINSIKMPPFYDFHRGRVQSHNKSRYRMLSKICPHRKYPSVRLSKEKIISFPHLRNKYSVVPTN